MTAAMYLPRFFVKQKLTMMVNRYEIHEANADGSIGRMMAVAQQKRMAFKEQVTFFRDDQRTEPVFSFQARQVMDMGAGYDVRDAGGAPLGVFRKDFGQSLLRSTFHLSAPDLEATGQERNQMVGVLRRFIDFPFAFHFDFKDQVTGAVVMSSERQMSLRDRYVVTVPDPRLDFRLAASMAVGLDALLAR
ncbi:MAG: hypothetical protein ABWX73_06455 [Marmoricola sp.]